MSTRCALVPYFLCAVGVAITVGCSIQRAPNTASFYEQETVVAKICLSGLDQMPADLRLKTDPVTGRSPLTTAAWCYASQIRGVVGMMNYPHSDLVNRYADYLIKLTEARDKGLITNTAMLASYQQASMLFRQSIASADQQIESASRRELADRLAVFAQAMSGLALEQDRQRQLNSPVVCRLGGVYVMNQITCR